jgi:hypothetical protein
MSRRRPMDRKRGRPLVNNSGTATGEGKPSKVKTHECHRHETRSEGLRAEQDVKRLRKPEDGAESGEVPGESQVRRETEVLSDSRCSKFNALKGPKPQERAAHPRVTGDGGSRVGKRTNGSRHRISFD